MRSINCFFASFFLCAVSFLNSSIAHSGWFSSDCDIETYEKSAKKWYQDANQAVSIYVPVDWSVNDNTQGSHTELLVKSRSCSTTIIVASRALDVREKSVSSNRLMSELLSQSLSHLRSMGHTVLDNGKSDEFNKGWPLFVIVSQDLNKEKLIMSYGGVTNNRNISVLVFTELDSVDRNALEQILRDAVSTIVIN